ncbi:response regulator [Candidatus Woesearchaeota archaeon]|nr:response regulator [Candidatus Woesearchaeota archaeon]
MKGPILLVDDEIAEVLGGILKDAGYSSINCTDGSHAIQQIQGGLEYKLAIVDVVLPDMDGEQVINASRKRHPEVPIVSVSGYKNKPAGSEHHFVKPFNFDEFFRIIDSYFKAQPSQ